MPSDKKTCDCGSSEFLFCKDLALDKAWKAGNKFCRVCAACGNRYFLSKSMYQQLNERYVILDTGAQTADDEKFVHYFDCPVCEEGVTGYPDDCPYCDTEFEWPDDLPTDDEEFRLPEYRVKAGIESVTVGQDEDEPDQHPDQDSDDTDEQDDSDPEDADPETNDAPA